MGLVDYTARGAVAVITIDSPPVNGLGHEVRRGIVEGLDRAAADPAVLAVVIAGAGKGFSGGADIREFGTPKMLADPALSGTKPSRVWISVDFPAPLGPRSPMVRPVSETRRSCKISRLPKRTLKPASSITG